MRVRRLDLRNFMRHAQLVVELPERGVVVVTGGNGAGKSSIVEGVAVAGWGKTLRGTSPWSDDDEAMSEAVVDDCFTLRRLRRNGRTLLRFGDVVDKAETYETTTKAQDALEAIIGNFDVWRRTSVFSSQDAAHFTLATDAERKRLLESILGLERFDVALERCRAELREAADKMAEHERKRDVLAAVVEERTAAVDRAEAEQPGERKGKRADVAQLEADLKEARRLLRSVEADIEKNDTEYRKTVDAQAKAAARLSRAEDDYERVRASRCGECGQDIPAKLRAEQAAKLGAEKERFEERRAHLDFERGELVEDRKEFAAEKRSLERRVAGLLEQAAVAKVEAEQLRASASRLRSAKIALDAAKAEHNDVAKEAAKHGQEAALLQECERVLGLRGVRAHVLGRALSGVESVANSWLAKIAGEGLRLKLKSYSERKNGTVADAISLDVEGAGGGNGYSGASGGERRRIDVALLFALAEIATAASGRPAGTLFVDECFDALDMDGVDAVSSALADLARERPIVVITHNDELLRGLDGAAAQRIRVGA